jgi:hypothetical protein
LTGICVGESDADAGLSASDLVLRCQLSVRQYSIIVSRHGLTQYVVATVPLDLLVSLTLFLRLKLYRTTCCKCLDPVAYLYLVKMLKQWT